MVEAHAEPAGHTLQFVCPVVYAYVPGPHAYGGCAGEGHAYPTGHKAQTMAEALE